MAATDIVFVHPATSRIAVVFAGLCLLAFLLRLGARWSLSEDGLALLLAAALGAYFAYAFFRDPRVALGARAMDYAVSNRAFPMFASETEIPYASMRSLIEVPGRRDGPAVAIGYVESGEDRNLRLTSGDIEGVGEMAGELSKRSGIPVRVRWTF